MKVHKGIRKFRIDSLKGKVAVTKIDQVTNGNADIEQNLGPEFR